MSKRESGNWRIQSAQAGGEIGMASAKRVDENQARVRKYERV